MDIIATSGFAFRMWVAADPEFALSWQMEYMLGTYSALKYYAWKYFEKMEQSELVEIYKAVVYEAWQEAFKIKKEQDVSKPEVKAKIAVLLKSAHEKEIKAVDIMAKKA